MNTVLRKNKIQNIIILKKRMVTIKQLDGGKRCEMINKLYRMKKHAPPSRMVRENNTCSLIYKKKSSWMDSIFHAEGTLVNTDDEKIPYFSWLNRQSYNLYICFVLLSEIKLKMYHFNAL